MVLLDIVHGMFKKNIQKLILGDMQNNGVRMQEKNDGK